MESMTEGGTKEETTEKKRQGNEQGTPPFSLSANPILMWGRSLQLWKMLNSLTRSKFYTKCNSLIKVTKVRLEVSRKKKNAVVKYLKNDIADLLRIGFDSNAYSRAQGLILEHNLIAAYKFVEDFCDCIATNLAVLDKQKECPEECREAIQSLMYAAARLPEFPEVRDLRSLFSHRYGDSLELYINKEFEELLNPRRATKEMKLQLLRDVAREFSINWDSKFIEDKLLRPPHASQQNQNAHNVGSNDLEDSNHKTIKSKDEAEVPSPRSNNEKRRLYSSSGSETTDLDSSEPSRSSMGTISTASEDEVSNRKIPYRFLPPPYVRTRLDKQDLKDQGFPKSSSPDNAESGSELQLNSRSVGRRQQMKAVMGDEKASDGGEGEDEEQHRKKRARYERTRMKRKLEPLSWRSRDESGKGELEHAGGDPGSAASSSSDSGTGRRGSSLSADSKVSGHVHPNLPEYDSLSARIAAFMGK